MTACSIALPAPTDLNVSVEAPLEVDFPALNETGAVCIGLAFEWRHQQQLHEFAMRHTLPDEHARASRFADPEDGLRNLLGRALLRRVAVHYGGMAANEAIRTNTWGKPELDAYGIGGNASYDGNQVWVALSRYSRVGINIESAIAASDIQDLAAGFHPDELSALRRLPDSKMTTIRCWSRKEAVLKATGMGLALPLRAYAVDCDARPCGWLRIAPPASHRDQWTTVDLPIGKEYFGALAIEGRVDNVNVLRLKTGP